MVDIFQVSTSKKHKNGEPKETQTTIKQTTTVTPLPEKTIPVPRVNKHESPAAVLKVTPKHEKEVHIIPLEETQEKAVPRVPVSFKGTNIIPMDADSCEQTQAYIHKYNTRSSPQYAFAAAISKIGKYPQSCNHVIHPTTGTACSYRKLSAGGGGTRIISRSLEEEFSQRI